MSTSLSVPAAKPAPRKRWRFAAVSLVGVALISAVWALVWRSPRYDFDRVHPAIQDLQVPYQSLTTCHYLDGGSIGIAIIDRGGKQLRLAIPCGEDGGAPFNRLFLGALHASEPNATEVEFTTDTKLHLAAMVDAFGQDPEAMVTLVELRGAPRDHFKVWMALAGMTLMNLIGQ